MNIAFLSGYDDFSYAKQAIQYNIISYMLKPLTIDGIAAELRTVHQKMDAQFALFRQASQTQAPPRQDKRAVFLMPLVLDEYAQPDANTGTYAVECGLLQDKTDKPYYTVMAVTIQTDQGKACTTPAFASTVDKLAVKYLRNVSFFSGGRVISVLLGNPSDFEEYMHILADEISQIADRVLGCRLPHRRQPDDPRPLPAPQCLPGGHGGHAEGRPRRRGVRFVGDLKPTAGGSGLCQRALEALDKHYMEADLSLVSLSGMLDVSPNHLSACIKKYAGETFINILIRKRMEAARQLLETTDLRFRRWRGAAAIWTSTTSATALRNTPGSLPTPSAAGCARPPGGRPMTGPAKTRLRITTILVSMVVGVVAVILVCCIGLFLNRYHQAIVQNARTSSEQAVAQVSNTVADYLEIMDQSMSIVQQTLGQPAAKRDSMLNAFLNFRPDVVAVTSYSPGGALLDCWTLGRDPKEHIVANLSFDYNRARQASEPYMTAPHVETIFDRYYPWVVTMTAPLETGARRPGCPWT